MPSRRASRVRRLLDARNLLERHFHAKVAARHHERVSNGHDLLDALDRLRLFDLGHHQRPAFDDFLDLDDVLRALNERERNPVDILLERRGEIGVILVGHGGGRDGRVGQAHALLVGDAPRDFDDGQRAASLGRGDPQHHFAVVDEDPVPLRERTQDFRMRQIDARLAPGRGVAVKDEGLAALQVGAAAGERAEPELRPLQVDKDADRAAGLFLHIADHRDPLPHPVMRSMAHVDAEDVRAGGEQGRDGLSVGRSGPESGDDFDAAATGLHWRSPIIGGAYRYVRFRPGLADQSNLRAAQGFAWSVSCTVQLFEVLAGVDFEEPGSVVAAHKAILSAVDLELAI